MLVKYTILGAASGKLGGMVASHNSAGAYFRTLGQPVNPRTPEQVAVRTILSNLAATWLTLSETFREGWATYAINVSVPGRFGEPIFLSAQAMYIRNNVARILAGFTVVNKPPVIFTNADLAPVDVTPIEVTDILTVTFDDTQPWVNDPEAGLLIFGSRQQNPTRLFFGGGYLLAGSIQGDAITPPTSPDITLVNLTELTAGNLWYGRAVLVLSDGRISVPQFLQRKTIGV